MRAVALVLIVGVFARYDAVNMLSQMFGMSPPAIYYILGGLWESALAAVILLLSYQMRECIWRRIIRAATIIGIIEGIIYLTKSDEEFVRTYIYGHKGWF